MSPLKTAALYAGVSEIEMQHFLDDVGLKISIKEKDRGDGRKAHYGSGKQPIDTWLELGWAPYAYAANVVKYLRRDKELEHSIESAKFYYKELSKLANKESIAPYGTRKDCLGSTDILHELVKELTVEELGRLNGKIV